MGVFFGDYPASVFVLDLRPYKCNSFRGNCTHRYLKGLSMKWTLVCKQLGWSQHTFLFYNWSVWTHASCSCIISEELYHNLHKCLLYQQYTNRRKGAFLRLGRIWSSDNENDYSIRPANLLQPSSFEGCSFKVTAQHQFLIGPLKYLIEFYFNETEEMWFSGLSDNELRCVLKKIEMKGPNDMYNGERRTLYRIQMSSKTHLLSVHLTVSQFIS